MRNRLVLPPRTARSAVVVLAASALAAAAAHHAAAQAIVLAVNGDPITSVDIEQQIKILRALHKPATQAAAEESAIDERLKAHEASRFGVTIKDSEIGEQVAIDAKKLKTTPQALLAAIQKNGVSNPQMLSYFKAELGYSVLIKALNRGVEASEVQVRQELAKEKGKTSVTNYTIRQVVFTLNPGDPPPMVQASVKAAEALRTRFTSCATGLPYARTLPGVAVREPLTRSSTQLGDGIRDLLDKTPVGHLTPPSRSENGVELIAVCDRSASKNDDELRKTIGDRLLSEHFATVEAAKFKELRSTAVISRPQ